MTATLQYIIADGVVCGFLLSAGPKGFRAFNADGLPLGLFEDEHLAAKAIYEQAATN